MCEIAKVSKSGYYKWLNNKNKISIQEILEIEVLDRTALILKIFALRAKTYEAKLQVEVARLNYLQIQPLPCFLKDLQLRF